VAVARALLNRKVDKQRAVFAETSLSTLVRPQADTAADGARLHPRTIGWLQALPRSVRPVETLGSYPRLLNRMALCWPDPDLAERLFDDLLINRRDGRVGFSATVTAELMALREFHHDQRRTQVASARWSAEQRGTTDRLAHDERQQLRARREGPRTSQFRPSASMPL
jgi:hypothetical protein